MELNERKLKVLSSIARIYIETGEPVGSKALVQDLGLSVSSATIRNDMAELSQMGLLTQPHTSAGRVPTNLGMRLYVDRLMERGQISHNEKVFIDSLFSGQADVEKLLEVASAALADYTNCASFSTTPLNSQDSIKHIELIPAGRHSVVFVIITTTNLIKSRMSRVDNDISPETLQYLTGFFNDNIVGVRVSDITPPFIQTLAVSLGEYALGFSPLLFCLSQLAQELTDAQFVIEGQSNLLNYKEFSDHAQNVLKLLSNGQDLLGLLSDQKEGVQVVIGVEANRDELANSSVLYTNYHYGNRINGTVGILGPTRLDYAKLIPLIEYFSDSLGNMLSQLFFEDEEDIK